MVFKLNPLSPSPSPYVQEMVQMASEEEQEAAAEAAEAFLSEDLPENVFGSVKAGAGMWASCLRIMHPTEVRRGGGGGRGEVGCVNDD